MLNVGYMTGWQGEQCLGILGSLPCLSQHALGCTLSLLLLQEEEVRKREKEKREKENVLYECRGKV
jgi:hypothetical protein